MFGQEVDSHFYASLSKRGSNKFWFVSSTGNIFNVLIFLERVGFIEAVKDFKLLKMSLDILKGSLKGK